MRNRLSTYTLEYIFSGAELKKHQWEMFDCVVSVQRSRITIASLHKPKQYYNSQALAKNIVLERHARTLKLALSLPSVVFLVVVCCPNTIR